MQYLFIIVCGGHVSIFYVQFLNLFNTLRYQTNAYLLSKHFPFFFQGYNIKILNERVAKIIDFEI